MNAIVRAFVEDVVEAVSLPDPIVEFGALQVEAQAGADLRDLFPGRPFTGTDFRPGPGVDRVEDLRALTYEDASVGTAICLETLEHCEDPISAARELARVVAPGGVALVSVPMLIGIHAHPNDYFRYTPEALRSLLAGFAEVWTGSYGLPEMPYWVFAVATHGRPEARGALDPRMPRLTARQQEFQRAPGAFRVGALRMTPGQVARTLGPQLPRVLAQGLRGRLRRTS